VSNGRNNGHRERAAGLAEAGRAAWRRGDAEGALERLRQSVRLDPGNPAAWNDLGAMLVSLDRSGEAEGCFGRALEISSDHASALVNYGGCLYARGALDEAEEYLQAAVRADPDRVAAHYNLAQLLRRKLEFERAATALRRVLDLNPLHLNAWLALGETSAYLGDMDEADRCYREADRVNPGNLPAKLGLALSLPQVCSGKRQMEAMRARYDRGLAGLEDGLEAALERPVAERLEAAQYKNFLLAYHGRNDLELQRRFSRFQRALLESALPQFYAPIARGRESGGRIRVGFASSNFYSCTVGKYFRNWIIGLDERSFETVVFSADAPADALNREIRAASHEFHELPAALQAGAGMIHSARLDVLIYPELGMYPKIFALANMRLAPLQCAAWGHPVTSGHDNVDWFISVEGMEPPGAEAHYSERLVTLPGIGTAYPRPPVPEAVARGSLGLPDEGTLLLFPQSLFKIHPDNDAVLADILAHEPSTRLVMFEDWNASVTRGLSERLGRALAARGEDIAGRVTFLPRARHGDYLRINLACDLMLDSMHWSGGNTALDALACGLPVVTLPGAFMRGRQTMAMLRAVGMDELVAKSPADYVDIALALCRDGHRRAAIRAAIRERNAVLFDQREPVRALQELLKAGAQGTGLQRRPR